MSRVLSHLRMLLGCTWLQLVWGMRVPQNLVYQFFMAGLMLVLLGLVNGTQEYLVTMVPGLIALGAASRGMTGIGGTMSTWRVRGTWRTLQASPIPTGHYFGSLVLSQSVRTLLTVGVMLVVAYLAFGYRQGGSLLLLFVYVTVGVAVFGAMGLMISYCIRSPLAVSSTISVLMVGMVFTSDALFRLKWPWLDTASQYLPLSRLVHLVRTEAGVPPEDLTWTGDVLVLTTWLLVCSAATQALARRRVEEF